MVRRLPNLPNRVPRYSRSNRVLTEVNQSYEPAEFAARLKVHPPRDSAKAQMWGHIKSGFDAVQKYIEPGVIQEQTLLGERQAVDDFEAGSYNQRNGLTIRSQAYNATGERLITNRASRELSEGLDRALRESNGSMRALEANLQALQGEIFGSLPEIPGLRSRLAENFDTGVAAARRRVTQIAASRARAANARAAREAAAVATEEVTNAAFMAASPEELASVLSGGVEALVQHGPRHEFTVNGVTYPADASRSGQYSEGQLESTITDLTQESTELFLRADYERSETPALWAQDFEEAVLSGESGLPPDRALSLLNTFQSAAYTDENRRLAAERDERRAIETAVEQGLAPYVTAAENGVVVTIPQEDRARILAATQGNPELVAEVNRRFAAADLIVELNGMDPATRAAAIEAQISAIEATPGITVEEAQLLEVLGPQLEAVRSAVSRESTGISALEQLVNSGAIPTDEQMLEIGQRAQANPELASEFAVLEESLRIIGEGRAMTLPQREEMLTVLDEAIAEVGLQGGQAGVAATRRRQAVELAQEHFETLEGFAQNDAMRFARAQGIELPPLPSGENTNVLDIAATIAERTALLRPHTSRFGVENPVPLSQSEREQISDYFQAAPNSARVAFLDAFTGMSRSQREPILAALGADNPPILAASRIAATAPSAARAVLAGVGVRVEQPSTLITQVETATLAPLTTQGVLPGEDYEVLRETATRYAIGMAAREGLPQITAEHLERGFDLALGADDNGNGGLESVGRYGQTITPTGVQGSVLEQGIRNLTPERWTEIAGGPILDREERPVRLDRLWRAIGSLRPIGEGVYLPVHRDGGYFYAPGSETMMLTIRLEDLQ
jgi:hypothetical protein